ncbi:ATP-binding cassette domain-containing protein [Bosea sp. (in: a-proteobacteria)]|uniref:ATP-binding cassette domain-containing protein n=1 Tax=Bosea sp. (in: a-proteobacteria) TaxID=1871050 RepID=UPI0026092ABD|nr:ATP-binding cassette domain-containing protein [Bosea sp. (in: a-proteobacteria)]MCO5089498.1 ATP-binding cassette domain-containing protein [Bosea sp. (in: a-proteobacteria)]
MALGRLIRAGRELAHTLLGASKLMPMAKLSQSLIEQRIDPLVSGVRVPSLSGSIDMTGVSFFHGERRILSDIDLSVAQGEFLGLAGPSGGGKSTLLALLSGLERPQSGRVLLGGYELAALDRRQIAGQIGMVMQNSRLFPGSIFQNIRGVSDIDLDEAWHFAELAGIAEELRQFPMGLQTIVVEGGSGLATGQAQRILIARALAKKPAVLVLDEAMSALDGASQQRILATLSRLPLTRILVSHRPSTLAKADRIVVLQRGTIVDDGSPEDIMRRQPLFHARG